MGDCEREGRLETPENGELVWLGFSSSPPNTVVRGPYTSQEAAVEAVAQYDAFHVEARRVRDDAAEDEIARDVHPTY